LVVDAIMASADRRDDDGEDNDEDDGQSEKCDQGFPATKASFAGIDDATDTVWN
jgi:hypothetical protein